MYFGLIQLLFPYVCLYQTVYFGPTHGLAAFRSDAGIFPFSRTVLRNGGLFFAFDVNKTRMRCDSPLGIKS